jgi:hypothetical protein
MNLASSALLAIALAAGVAAAPLAAQPEGGGSPPPPPTPAAASPAAPAGRLEQLVAPIALYPDALLGQILMAAAYPLEVVEADRWVQEPENADLRDQALSEALADQDWDPSIKSLTAFPQVLRMLDGQIDWTEALGEAFISNPAGVMDAVQRLRAKAQAAGQLASNREIAVSQDDGEIGIAPEDASTAYVPTYDPQEAYGSWDWPDYPPYYFPGWYDCYVGDFGWCWSSMGIYAPFWGWDTWDWRRHRLGVDRQRWGRLDGGRPPPTGGAWAYDPAHRHGVPYDTASVRARYNAATDVAGVDRAARGFASAPGAEAPDIVRGTPGIGAAGGEAPRFPPSYESYGRGADVREQEQRGAASRGAVFAGPRGGSFGGSRGGGRPR